MKLRVRHETVYRYPQPAWDSFNELWLCPVDDDRQTRLDFSLGVRPASAVRERVDYYGNRVHDFHAADGHLELAIEANAVVTTFAEPAVASVSVGELAELRPRFFEFLAPTRRLPLGRDWPAAKFMKKPVSMPELVATIGKLLAEAESLRAAVA